MTQYYVYAKIIGSKNVPKGSYTAWVGTTPIGFAKKGDMTSDKQHGYYSKCVWSMEVKKDFNKTSIEFIIKHHKLLGGESEAGRIQLPLKWFPANQVVTDWFPIASKSVSGIDGEEMLLNITVHLAEARVQPFSHPPGSLLVAPAWNRPGLPAIPPTHLAPMSSVPQQAMPAPPYQGYPPQQMPPPQPYPVSANPPQQFPQYPSQPLYPQPNMNAPQGYYPPQQIPVISDASQPAFSPPFMYSPQAPSTQTPPGSVGMPAYPPLDPQIQQSPIYMPPPAYDPSNPYLDVDPNEIPLPPSNPTQHQQQNQSSPPSYPNIPHL